MVKLRSSKSSSRVRFLLPLLWCFLMRSFLVAWIERYISLYIFGLELLIKLGVSITDGVKFFFTVIRSDIAEFNASTDNQASWAERLITYIWIVFCATFLCVNSLYFMLIKPPVVKVWKFLCTTAKLFYQNTRGLTRVVRLISLQMWNVFDYVLGKPIYFMKHDADHEGKIYKQTSKFYLHEKILALIKAKSLFGLDRLDIFIRLYKMDYSLDKEKLTRGVRTAPKVFYRLKHARYQPYYRKYRKYLVSDFIGVSKKQVLAGVHSIWAVLRRWLLSVSLSISALYFLSAVKLLPVSVTLFQWFALLMFLYWLLSGFVFFIKKYQFGKFTSVIQRFWRRSYILFWLIESCLLVVFFYLTVNSTQESAFMLDQSQVFKTHLFSWRLFLPKLFLVSLLVIIGYLFLLSIKWNVFKKNIPFLFVLTGLLTYLLWIEFYQIYHISNFYANFFWVYDVDERLWTLESDVRRTRIVNHYLMILFFLKFWHIVFIYGFWIFFVLRVSELTRVRYPLYSANFQNFLILYCMSWLFMYPWLKFVFHRFLEVPYFWFYVDNRRLFVRVFMNDLRLVWYAIQHYLDSCAILRFNAAEFFYWAIADERASTVSFRKHWIRDQLIHELSAS